ncbi:MAG: hypothetical protein ABIJ09_00130 [Pseudomonadota bacterium]
MHRALVYAAAVPGWGNWYAGHRLHATVLFVLLGLLLLWFFSTMILTVTGLVSRMFAAFDEAPSRGPLNLPVLPMAASVLGIYLLWLWGMAAAVDGAVRARTQKQLPAQRSVPWAVFMAWLCPGTGQLYLGARGLGFALVVVTALSRLLVIPAYRRMIDGAMALVQEGKVSATDVEGLIDAVHALQLQVDYGAGNVLMQLTALIALALTAAAIHTTYQAARTANQAMGLLLLGWLCPGAAQLLQGRTVVGGSVLVLYLASLLLLALLFGVGATGPGGVDSVEWWLIVLQWGAMVEAVIHLTLLREDPSPGR